MGKHCHLAERPRNSVTAFHNRGALELLLRFVAFSETAAEALEPNKSASVNCARSFCHARCRISENTLILGTPLKTPLTVTVCTRADNRVRLRQGSGRTTQKSPAQHNALISLGH